VRCIGEPPAWLREIATATDAPFPPPEAVFVVDTVQAARDDAAIAAAMADARRPDRKLSSAELQKKIPALKNPAHFDLAVTQWNFPRPTKITAGFGLRELDDRWSERAIDRWLESMKDKKAQLALFV
jgi:hypothetical protein